MNTFRNILIASTAFGAGLQSAFAKCMLNGVEIPCSQISPVLWAIPIVMGIIGLLFFVFWLWMLIDAIKNEKENKLVWVLVILFLNLLGALIYYFAAKRKRIAK